jgi:hypothetical protein
MFAWDLDVANQVVTDLPMGGNDIRDAGAVSVDELHNADSFQSITYQNGEFKKQFHSSLDAALSEQQTAGNGWVLVPPGTHSYSNGIVLDSRGMAVVSPGSIESTTLEYTGSGNAFEATTNQVRGAGFTLDLTNAGSNAKGAFIQGVQSSQFALRIYNAPTYGMHLNGSPTNGGVYHNHFPILRINSSGEDGMLIDGENAYVNANSFGTVAILNSEYYGLNETVVSRGNAFESLSTSAPGSASDADATNSAGYHYNGGATFIGSFFCDGLPSGVFGIDASDAPSDEPGLGLGTKPKIGGSDKFNDPNGLIHSPFEHLNSKEVSADTGAKETTLGYSASGWKTIFDAGSSGYAWLDQAGNEIAQLFTSGGFQHGGFIRSTGGKGWLGVEVDRTSDPAEPVNGFRLYYRSDVSPPEVRAINSNGTVITLGTF